MSSEAVAFLIALIMAAFLLFLSVYVVIMLTDLECDYINPIDCCNNLNVFIMPEIFAQAFLVGYFVLSGCWLAMFINLPLLIFHINKIAGNHHMLDATEIFRTLPNHKTEGFAKIGFYLFCFFYYLYAMIVALVAEHPVTNIRS